MKRLLLSMIGLVLATCFCPAFAQDYPSDTIRIVVPFSPGSTTDVLARLIASELQKSSSTAVIIENKPGALGTVGAASVARAKPDGYTLLLSSTASNSSAPFLLKSVNYDAVKSFTHISRLAVFQWVLVAQKSFKNIEQLLNQGRSRKLNFAYGSASSQVAGAAVNKLLGIDAVGVPYKGQPQALSDLVGQRIDYMMVDIGAAAALIKANEIQAIAVAGARRSSLLSDVPTFEEAGLPPFSFATWTGISGPSGMSINSVAFLEKHVRAALESSEIAQKLRAIGGELVPADSSEFQQFVQEQLGFWAAKASEAGIEPE